MKTCYICKHWFGSGYRFHTSDYKTRNICDDCWDELEDEWVNSEAKELETYIDNKLKSMEAGDKK